MVRGNSSAQITLKATKIVEDAAYLLMKFICGPWLLAKFASNETAQAQLSEVAQFPNRWQETASIA
jgi:hypothetical protein